MTSADVDLLSQKVFQTKQRRDLGLRRLFGLQTSKKLAPKGFKLFFRTLPYKFREWVYTEAHAVSHVLEQTNVRELLVHNVEEVIFNQLLYKLPRTASIRRTNHQFPTLMEDFLNNNRHVILNLLSVNVVLITHLKNLFSWYGAGFRKTRTPLGGDLKVSNFQTLGGIYGLDVWTLFAKNFCVSPKENHFNLGLGNWFSALGLGQLNWRISPEIVGIRLGPFGSETLLKKGAP